MLDRRENFTYCHSFFENRIDPTGIIQYLHNEIIEGKDLSNDLSIAIIATIATLKENYYYMKAAFAFACEEAFDEVVYYIFQQHLPRRYSPGRSGIEFTQEDALLIALKSISSSKFLRPAEKYQQYVEKQTTIFLTLLNYFEEKPPLISLLKPACEAGVLSILHRLEVEDAGILGYWNPTRYSYLSASYFELPHIAAQYGHSELVRLLLKRGADVNSRDSHGKTVLMIACMSQSIETVKVLLSHGADLSIRDSEGNTALHHAISFNHEYSYDPDYHPDQYYSLFLLKKDSGLLFKSEVVELFLEHDFDVNIFDVQPLILDVKDIAHRAVIKILMRQGINSCKLFNKQSIFDELFVEENKVNQTFVQFSDIYQRLKESQQWRLLEQRQAQQKVQEMRIAEAMSLEENCLDRLCRARFSLHITFSERQRVSLLLLEMLSKRRIPLESREIEISKLLEFLDSIDISDDAEDSPAPRP